VDAKTIQVPTDYSTVRKAVEAAESGDRIELVSDAIEWTNFNLANRNSPNAKPGGILINNKDLEIVGNFNQSLPTIQSSSISLDSDRVGIPSPSLLDSMLWIENSNVVLKDINFKEQSFLLNFVPSLRSTSAPIRIFSGSLKILNCSFEGKIFSQANLQIINSFVKPNTTISNFPYGTHTTMEFPIQIGPAENIHVEIENTDFDTRITDFNHRAVHVISIDNVINSEISLQNSTIWAGDVSAKRNAPIAYITKPGGIPILIENCENVTFHLEESVFFGGKGHLGDFDSDPPQGQRGGFGGKIVNSNINLIGGKFVGGPGESAGSYRRDISDTNPPFLYPGKGGIGLGIFESEVRYQDVQFEAGSGGEPFINPNDPNNPNPEKPGSDGEPLFVDENSEFVSLSQINKWELY